jgi:hypothetical protein
MAYSPLSTFSSARRSSTYKIHNDSVFEIAVVMDSGREEHVIVPNGIATFVKASPLDRPTFHVWKTNDAHQKSQELTSKKVGYWDAIRAEGEYSFTGGELD